jgi:hypothetical protein
VWGACALECRVGGGVCTALGFARIHVPNHNEHDRFSEHTSEVCESAGAFTTTLPVGSISASPFANCEGVGRGATSRHATLSQTQLGSRDWLSRLMLNRPPNAAPAYQQGDGTAGGRGQRMLFSVLGTIITFVLMKNMLFNDYKVVRVCNDMHLA